MFYCSSVHYPYFSLLVTLCRICATNVVLQLCFLRTCSHLKRLVSYLGPFTAPLCPSKTASGLVQTLSGNNRWLLYCLRSFTLKEQLLKQMLLDQIQYHVNVPLGKWCWNGTNLYLPTVLSGVVWIFGETQAVLNESEIITGAFKFSRNRVLWKPWTTLTEKSGI